MAWVVDTCLLIDLAVDDPKFFTATARLLDGKQGDGLVVCPISVVELSPVFGGQIAAVEEFLGRLDIAWPETWTLADTQTAFSAWNRYVAGKRDGSFAKRPIADVLIGSFSARHQGLLTRNSPDFRQLFPALPVIEP